MLAILQCWLCHLGIRRSQLEYNSLLQEKITGSKVLDMPATAAQTPANLPKAQGYKYGKNGIEQAQGEAADLKSNALDMYNWLKAQLFPPASVQNAINLTQDKYFFASNQCAGSKKPTLYDMGLAWQMRPLDQSPNSPQLFIKDGATGLGGQSCWMGYVFNPNAGVVVLTNGVGAKQPPSFLGLQILNTLLGKAIPSEPESEE
jgi:hypothetical protein